MNYLAETDPELYDILEREANREESTIELIASENFTSQGCNGNGWRGNDK